MIQELHDDANCNAKKNTQSNKQHKTIPPPWTCHHLVQEEWFNNSLYSIPTRNEIPLPVTKIMCMEKVEKQRKITWAAQFLLNKSMYACGKEYEKSYVDWNSNF